MPFTFSHPAAAAIVSPALRRGWLPLAPFVIGTMAPDFEYVWRLEPYALLGHSFPGVVTLTLPSAMTVVMWWEWRGRTALRQLLALPSESERRDRSWWGGTPATLGTVVAVALGVATHVGWDAFTHWDAWGATLFPVLAEPVGRLPGVHWANVLQHLSTLVGGVVVGRWLARQMQRAGALPALRARWRLRVFAALASLCVATALWNAPRTGAMTDRWRPRIVVGRAVVGALAGLAAGLLAYTAVSPRLALRRARGDGLAR